MRQLAAKGSAIKDTGADKVFFLIDYILLGTIFLLVIYPLIYILSSSFSDAEAVLQGRVWLLPIEPSRDWYKAVFQYDAVWVR